MSLPEVFAPRKLGPYLIGRKLGVGGMAAVFAAIHEPSARLVALKILSPSIQQEDADHGAFVREAALATRLDHPHIVRTFDVGTGDDGTMYIAMDLVHGASLSACMRASKEAAPLSIALRVACDVADALHAAHELTDPERGPLGLVHQDVSPQNVLVDYDGVLKLVDFGVARLGNLEGSRTESLRGKPSYASPEQIAGKHIDRRTDIFALGIITWELLAGMRLFRRDTSAATYLAVIQDPIPHLREKNATVPPAIADELMRALERNREARFKTAKEFREALLAAAQRHRIEPASDSELSLWVASLVPPKIGPAELRQEIEDEARPPPASGMQPTPQALLAPQAVPDLDLPGASSKAPPRTSAPEIRRPAASSPAVSRPPAASSPAMSRPPTASSPQLRPQSSPSASRVPQAISFDASPDDDFDMEIERDGASAMQPTIGAQPASHASTGRPSGSFAQPRAVSSAGLELAASRAGLRPQVRTYESSFGAKAAGWAITVLVSAAAVGALVHFAHKKGGMDPLRFLPQAFDGSSAPTSGAVSLVALVFSVVLGFVGVKSHPRSWALVGSGAAMMLTALAMVTVTLGSTGEAATPPDGVLLLPFLLPLSLAALAVGLVGRGAYLFQQDSIARKLVAVPVASLAGAVAFLAIETSALASLLH